MDFDADDPLADLLSEGSNDSFFDEPKPSAKRGSLPKTPEKKSMSDLFGLNDEKQTTEPAKPSDDWLGISRKSPQTVQVAQPSRTAKKISFEDDDDILTTMGLEKKIEPKTISESVTPAKIKLDSAKKSALLESILGSPKKALPKLPETNLLEAKPVQSTPIKAEAFKPTAIVAQKTPSELSYGFSSLDAPREGRRRPASGVKDPLGLFSASEPASQEKSKSIQASPVKRREASKAPDWLVPNEDDSASTGKAEILFQSKNELKTKSVPNLSNIPDWLANEPLKTHKSESGINSIQQQQEHHVDIPDVDVSVAKGDNINDNNPSLQSLLTQQKLATSHMEYQNTAIALQQQESQILMTLQLKKYEDNLMDMQRKQQDVLVKQEQQFNSLLERQFAKQQVLENNMRLQQERINNHIQMLLSQPPVTAQETSQVAEASKTDELRKANKEETIRLYESLIESLKQRHQEELFLIEESYKKQFATIEQSADAVESRLKEELTDLKQASIDKCEELKKELDLEKAKHNAKMDELADRHKVEIKKLRENHDRVVEEVKYEYNTIIENIKQSKQAESGVFENASSYNDKLESNLQMLGINSKILFDLKEKVEKDYGVLHMAREESLKAKEEEIKLMRLALDKAREAAETERSQLMGLIRNLELKLVDQAQNAKEERWSMQQAAATLVARSAAVDRETQYNRKSLEYEREQLKTLKETLLAEQERVLLQLTEEKLALTVERSKLETAAKLSQSYEPQRVKAEIEAAVQVAREAAEMADKERAQLQRQQVEVESFKRNLIDRERKLEQRELDVGKAMQSVERKSRDGDRALAEAKQLEANYNERLRTIQSQLVHLTSREKKLAEEKIALSKERVALNNSFRQRKRCGLCAVDDPPRSIDEELEFEHVQQDPDNISHNIINSELTNLRRELQQTRRQFNDTMSE